MPRLMMSRPCAASGMARARTANAFSSPIRSNAATVLSMALPQNRAALEPNRAGNANTARAPSVQAPSEEAPDEISGASPRTHATTQLTRQKGSTAEIEFGAVFRILRRSGFKATIGILQRRALQLSIRPLRRGTMMALCQCRRCQHRDGERRPDHFLVQRCH